MSGSSFCHPAWSGAIHGIVPVVPTPFAEDELVDFESLERLIDFAADAGVTGVCLPAYGSEFYKLSESERVGVVRAAVKFAGGRVKIVAQSNHFSSKTRGGDGAAEPGCRRRGHFLRATTHVLAERRGSAPICQQGGKLGHGARACAGLQSGGASVGASFARRLREASANFRFLKLEEPLMGPKVHAIREATAGAVGVLEGWGGMYLLELLPAGICGAMPGIAMVDLFQSLVRNAREGDTVAASRLFEGMLPFIVYSLQNMELFHHCEKRLLVKRGLLQSAKVRDAGLSLDETAQRYLGFLCDGILEAVASNSRAAKGPK